MSVNPLAHFARNFSCYKACACVPVIGTFVSLKAQQDIANQLTDGTERSPQDIKSLIREKNDYKVGSIISSLLSAALMISAVALGILSSPIGVGLALVHVGLACLVCSQILKNLENFSRIQTGRVLFV